MGLRLRKYIESMENWAAKNYSCPSANISKLRNSCWKVCNGPCSYLKHGITKDALIGLQIHVRNTQVLWLVSAAKEAVGLHTAGEVWYLRLSCLLSSALFLFHLNFCFFSDYAFAVVNRKQHCTHGVASLVLLHCSLAVKHRRQREKTAKRPNLQATSRACVRACHIVYSTRKQHEREVCWCLIALSTPTVQSDVM